MNTDKFSEVAKRAYDLWESEGRPPGRDLDHWLRAEQELGRVEVESAPAGQIMEAAQTREAKPTAPAKRSRKPRSMLS